MMPRGMTPTRVRRRQSDAKWRASVAMCYNIMKNVIPNQKKLSRRKVSKALTLKETERHIVNLERKLKEIIEDRAPMSGKVVMVERDDNTMYPATFEDIKRDFALKQHSYFASSSGSGKKRYNIPADIEASLENISQQSCRLVVVNRSQVRSAPSLLPKLFKPASRKMSGLSRHDNRSHLENLLTGELEDHEFMKTVAHQQKTPSKVTLTPVASSQQNQIPFQPTLKQEVIPGTPSMEGGHSCSTPAKQIRQPQDCPKSGFTPVKLPEGFECKDVLLSFQVSPAKSTFGSPFSCFSSPQMPGSSFSEVSYFDIGDEDTNSNLFCTESIDLDDLSRDCTPDVQYHQVPSPKKEKLAQKRSDRQSSSSEKKELKCRRKLDQQYQEAEQDLLVPTGEEDICTDIDGYLLFYDDNSVSLYSQEEEWKERDSGLSSMWSSLSSADDKPVFPVVGGSQYGLEDSNSLSADLFDLDFKPLNHNSYKEFLGSSEACQEVPGYDLSGTIMDNNGLSSDLVPDMDQFQNNDKQNGEKESDGVQVVPEITAT